jgi:SNF2 family DNA or RNA helicase
VTRTARLDPLDPARVVLDVPDRDYKLAQDVPGSLWDRDRKVFTVPLSWAAWMALRGVFGDDLDVGPDLGQWTRDEFDRRVGPCLAVRSALDVAGDDLDPRLRPFQRAGVAMMACAERMLLGDDLGAGKTVQTILALRRLADHGHDVFPVVCVVPKSVKGQWAEEWETWWPGRDVRLVGGTAARRRRLLGPGGDVYVVNWEAVRYHSRLAPYGSIALKRCGEHRDGDEEVKTASCEVHVKELNLLETRSVVTDEAHRMRNVKAKQTRAVWAVQHGRTVRYRFSLTGTPIGEHPGELWSIMHGLAPEEHPRHSDHIDRYCLQGWSYFRGLDIIGLHPEHRDEFLGFFDPRFRRMPKELILPDLPPKVRVTREAELSPKQRRAYDELREKSYTRDESGRLLAATDGLSLQTRLTQYASATCEVQDDGSVRLAEPSPKLDVLMEILADTERPVAVTAASRQLIDLAAARLEAAGTAYQMLVGGMTDDQRTAALRDFREGRARVLLFTMQAGGEGVNMTAADTLVRLERSPKAILNIQTVGRLDRIGAEVHESITIVDVVAPNTVEASQARSLRRKESRLEEITRDKVTLDAVRDAQRLAALEAEARAIRDSTLETDEEDVT